MLHKIIQAKKAFRIALFLCLTFVIGISIGYFTNHVFSENAKFESFTKRIFKQEVSGSTLTLHYTLANPRKQGIQSSTITLGRQDTDTARLLQYCQTCENTLKSFSYSRLSTENQLTCDMLLLYYHARLSLGDAALLEEPLGASLGIQAQLPVLLAEYAFYTEQDILDYFKLLADVGPYFQSILTYEQKKSAAGYFMSDAALDRILKQCSAFIQNPDSNYMLEVFEQKLSAYGKFNEKEQKELNDRHKQLLLQKVIPAYQTLMNGLNSLRGTGKSSRGLACFPNGRQYYLYLLQTQVGTYVPVKKVEQRLYAQLVAECKEITQTIRKNPSLLAKVTAGTSVTATSILSQMKPVEMLETLRSQMARDFPSMEKPNYEIRAVHESMQDYLSPAFYLTPPLDIHTPNVIYLNQADRLSSIELFTTLAHEGFPGHLYQTLFFGQQSPSNIRCLFNFGGYVEGWATYVEAYAYHYAASLLQDSDASALTTLLWQNRSVNLCICSLLDIGIHYHGWSLEKCTAFLKTFGIREASSAKEIYQYIVETPGNYLKYYWGYLNFLDLKTSIQRKQGQDFSLKEFHQKILEIGPVPFPVLEKFIKK